jgi:uncharacterized protein (TIRG00374 family)
MKRRIPLILSAILLIVLIIWIDPQRLIPIVASADIALIAGALALAVFNRVFMALKWNLLLRVRGLRIGWWEAIRSYYVSTFVGLFLPPTVGSDVARTLMVERGNVSRAEIAASIVVERLVGLLALLVFGLIACVFFVAMLGSETLPVGRLFPVAAGTIVVTGALFVFSFTSIFSQFVSRVVPWTARVPLVRKFSPKIQRLYDAYREYRGHPLALLSFFLLTCLENALPIVRAWIVARALHVEVPLTLFLMVVPIELLLIRLPVTFDGFGVREGLFAYFLSTFAGVDKAVAFSVGLANHLLFLVALIPGGVMWALKKNKSAGGSLRREAEGGAPLGGVPGPDAGR